MFYRELIDDQFLREGHTPAADLSRLGRSRLELLDAADHSAARFLAALGGQLISDAG